MKITSSSNIYRILIFVLIILDVFLVLYSCQKHQTTELIFGDIPNDEKINSPDSDIPIYVTDSVEGDVLSGIGALGAYYAYIDTREIAGELTSVRKSEALGDPFTVDITGYLNGNPCGNCFKLDSIALNNRNEILASFSLRHPFPLPAHNPPEYRERLDLHVFDVRAIFFLKDELSKKVSFDGIRNVVLGPIGGDQTLDSDNSGFWASEDWDGATNLFDEYVDSFWHTDSDIHPYKIFFEDGSRGNVNVNSATGFTDPYYPSGHNVFPQGAGPDIKTINLGNIPKRKFGFIVVIAAAYGQAARFWGSATGQRGSPRYYLPEFNCKEPWKVKLDIPSTTDLISAGDSTSSMILNIDVCDWQHSYGTVRGDYNPRTDPLDSLHRSSKVKNVYAEIPGVSNIDETSTPISGTGLGSDPLHYSLTINNDKLAQQGQYQGLVAVTDELHGTNLEGYGVKRDGVTLFDINSFVTYAVFQASVIDREGSFGVGISMTNTDSSDYNGLGVNLDSPTGDNILAYGNMVHVVASILEGPGGNGWDVYYFRSINHGLTFETPLMLSKDWENGELNDQVEPSITMAPDTGRLYFVFTDKSHLRAGIPNDAVFMRYSKDHGLNFSSPATRISMADGACDQPSISASINGFVWIAYRQCNSMNDKSIAIRTSFDYGQNFFMVNFIHTPPYNCENPIILSHIWPWNYYMIGLIWRQESTYGPDLQFASSLDAGGIFNAPKSISFENYYEFASFPKADCDSNGNIYCAYRVNTYLNSPTKIFVSYGRKNTLDYVFENLGHINTVYTEIGDLDIFVSNLDHVYLSWNQDDPSKADIEYDIFVYKNTGGAADLFSLIRQIEEPSTSLANQEMPRLAGNEQGEVFLVYKDNSFTETSDIFMTMGIDE